MARLGRRRGANVASPIMYASNVARLDGNDYCLTAADGVATLRSHASSDVPKITHIVRYVTGTDSSIPNATVDDGDALPLPANPTRNGYRFLGWYDAETGGNRLDGTNAVTSDITVYANWERIIPTYTLSYDLNGGDGTIASVTLNEGDKVKIPATDPTRDGHKFIGWFTESDGGDQTTADTVMSGNMTLYAHWERIIPTYTVTYDVNGGNGSIEQASVKEGGKVTIPTEKPTKDGYKFLGWFTAPDGGDKVTADTVVNGNMTVYAQWERIIPTYTVSYDVNGGNESYRDATVKEGEKITLPADPTREGYEFLGWFTAPTGGDRVTGDTVVTGAMTLYAHWNEIKKSFALTYDTDGGEHIDPVTLADGDKLPLPTPTRRGYTFLGWYNTKTGGNRLVPGTSTISGNMTAYVRWQKETTGENTNTSDNTNGNTNGNANANTGTNGNTSSGNSNENTGDNIGNGSNGSNGSTSPDDNLLGNAAEKEDGKGDGTVSGKPKLTTMLQQTGVTVSIFAIIGAAIGAVAAIRKRK